MSLGQVKRCFQYAGMMNLSRCMRITPTIIIPLFRGLDKDGFERLERDLRRKGRKQNLLHLSNRGGVLRLCKCGGYFKSVYGKNRCRLWHIQPPLIVELMETSSPLSRGETNNASTVSVAGAVPCLTCGQSEPVDKVPNGHRLTGYGGRKKTPHGVNLRFVSIF